jgi:hypothetical protein
MADSEDGSISNMPKPIISRLHRSAAIRIDTSSTGYRIQAEFTMESLEQADAAIEALQIIRSLLEGIHG